MNGRKLDRGGLDPRRPGLFLLLIFAGACFSGEPAQDVVELESGSVQLPQGARRHDIRLAGVGAEGEATPATVDAHVGDAIAFRADDGLTHSIVFLGERLDSAQTTFLDATGQRRSPPLLSAGARWVVSLANAPPGDYAFVCAQHGGRGVVRVAPAAAERD